MCDHLTVQRLSRRSLVVAGALALAGVLVPVDESVHGRRALVRADLNRNGVPVISRDSWGSPDGENSPLWVPVYQRPFHLIVHHTVTESGPLGGLATIQTIWAYHSYGLDWGDIGYNYLIDGTGNIYEGRAGGDDVVGAHTEHFNYGSVGIALMGDYSSQKPSRPLLTSLKTLLTMLCNKYGIDPQATFDDGAARFPTIGGHRDFNFTDCPGGNVYPLLPRLRYDVSKGVCSDTASAQGETVFVHAGFPATVPLVVRNTGTTTWTGRYSLRLIAGDLYRQLGLPTSYPLPDVGPNGTITVPLFLPALQTGQVMNTDWQLSDMTDNLVGRPFPFTVVALAPAAVMLRP